MIRPIDASNSSIYRTSLCHHADALNGFHGRSSHTQKFRSTWKNGYIPVFHKSPWWFNRKYCLMDKILHRQGWWLSHHLHGFIHPRWCRISSFNSISVVLTEFSFTLKVKCWRFSMFFSRKLTGYAWMNHHPHIHAVINIIPIKHFLATIMAQG